MASIVSTQTLIDVPHGSTRKWWRIRYIWDNGDFMDIDSFVSDTTNQASWIAARIPELEESQVNAEINQLLTEA